MATRQLQQAYEQWLREVLAAVRCPTHHAPPANVRFSWRADDDRVCDFAIDRCCDELDRLVYRTLGSMPGSRLPY